MTLTLQDLSRGRPEPLHRGRNVTKAEVHRIEIDGRPFAVKDYRPRPLWVRATVGRWSIRREARAYRALEGLAGVPALAGRPHPLVLVTDLVPGRSLAAWGRERPLPAGFFGRAKDLLALVHGRGVVQGDLHHRDLLVGEDGAAWLVDFSTALVARPGGGGPLWRLGARLDRRAVLKLQERFEPGTLTPAERGELERAPRLYRWVRRLTRAKSGR
jgi:hypothetical protein